MTHRLAGRVAWITGSSSGNGRATALRLAAEGARVVCSDRQPGYEPRGFDHGAETHVEIINRGGAAVFIACDVTDPDQVDAAAERCATEYGQLDICVANAGMAPMRDAFSDMSYATYAECVEVNQHGVWRTCRAAAALMTPRGAGRIIVISSIGGLRGIAASAAYNVSKHAVMGLVRTLANELAAHGVLVNAVNPGYIRTAMVAELMADPQRMGVLTARTPLGRLGDPADVAAAVAFLASDDAAFVTGTALVVDGGYTAV